MEALTQTGQPQICLARNNDFDSSKARSELGYHTRSYRETIRDEIAWLKETGKISAHADRAAA